MKKIIFNITSYIGICNDAEHFYVSIYELDNNEDIYVFARDFEPVNSYNRLLRKIDLKEAKYLNKKDRSNCLKAGDETERWNSIDDIKKYCESKFKDGDIAFMENGKINECTDIIQRNLKIVKTGQKIKITNFNGFSSSFKNLIKGSIHDVIKEPERYKDQELQNGLWVMGIDEPVLILLSECIVVKN